MNDWIPFAEGKYRVERAVITGPAGPGVDVGVDVEDAVIEVLEQGGQRRLRGRGRVPNELLVRLLDVGDELDLLLDLGAEFKYRMHKPVIQGGKVFAPGVKSFIQFLPDGPWEQVPEADFIARMSRIRNPSAQTD
jgi:hypothetical protein